MTASLVPDVLEHKLLPLVPHLFLNVNKHYNWQSINFIISHNYSNINELLVNYTRFNNTKLVEKILKVPRVTDNHLMRALKIAIRYDFSSIINLFISFNPFLTIEDSWYDTAENLSILSYTAGYGSDRTFENLLQSNLFDPTANFNETLRIILRERQLNKLKMLTNDPRIDLTAPIVDYHQVSITKYYPEESLRMAVEYKWLEAVQILLDQPSIVPFARALDFHLIGDNTELTQRLLELKKMPPTLADLEVACRENPLLAEDLLRDRRIKLEPNGGKALYNACLAYHLQLIKLLLDNTQTNETAVLQNIHSYPHQLQSNFFVAYSEWKDDN